MKNSNGNIFCDANILHANKVYLVKDLALLKAIPSAVLFLKLK